MDKTMEIVVVLMVLMIAAVIVIAFMSSQTDSFTGFSDNTTSNARCGLWESNYERKFCENGEEITEGRDTELWENLQDCDNVDISCG